MAAGVQLNSLGNSQKTFNKTFGTFAPPTVLNYVNLWVRNCQRRDSRNSLPQDRHSSVLSSFTNKPQSMAFLGRRLSLSSSPFRGGRTNNPGQTKRRRPLPPPPSLPVCPWRLPCGVAKSFVTLVLSTPRGLTYKIVFLYRGRKTLEEIALSGEKAYRTALKCFFADIASSAERVEGTVMRWPCQPRPQ